jgi:putative endonuclease
MSGGPPGRNANTHVADDRAELGRRGERLAEKHLKRLGCRILVRNYRCDAGEIDLIVRHAETIAFVEVKTRRSEDAADVEEAVNPHKRRQLIRVARDYLLRTPAAAEYALRFDIVGIVVGDDGTPEIRHIPEAFCPPREIAG